MGRPGFPLTIMDFQGRFVTEGACRAYLVECRWPEGLRCSACGGAEAGELHRRRLVWQCKRCGYQTSVTAGTVMHKTHTPLRLWFWAAYLVATHQPGISAKQLSRQLGLRYETAWLMLQKLRRAMVAPEARAAQARGRGRRVLPRRPRRKPAGAPLGRAKGALRGRRRGPRAAGRVRLAVVEDGSWHSLVEVSGERTTEVRAALTEPGIAIVGSHRLAVGPGSTLPIQGFTAIVEANSPQDGEQQIRAALSKFGGYDVADRGEAV